MESPAGYPESPMDQDDIPYPCKGCGEVSDAKKKINNKIAVCWRLGADLV